MKLKQSKIEYEFLYADNLEIFKSVHGFERSDNCVYVWVDTTQEWKWDLKWNIHIPFKPVYVGKGVAFGDITKWRAFAHKNDLLEEVINKNPSKYKCYLVSVGISSELSCVLESYLIRDLLINNGFKLNKIGNKTNTELLDNQLINKRRERKNEELFYKFLNI